MLEEEPMWREFVALIKERPFPGLETLQQNYLNKEERLKYKNFLYCSFLLHLSAHSLVGAIFIDKGQGEGSPIE